MKLTKPGMRCFSKEIFLLAIILLLVTFLCVHSFVTPSSVKIRPAGEFMVSEPVFLYRQDDEKWADNRLGDSQCDMAGSGCLVSCIASAVSTEGDAITPGQLNTLFSENEVYDSAGNIQWAMVEKIKGYHTKIYDSSSGEIIEACLQDEKYPIVRVRINGIGSYHYILIVGCKQGDYVCMDPAKDELTTLSQYGSKVYAIRCVWKDEISDE